MINQLDLRIYPHELPAWWNHPIIILFLVVVCVLGTIIGIMVVRSIIEHRRKKMWNQAYALLKTLERMSHNDRIAVREQAFGLSAILKSCVAYVCRTNLPLSLTDKELCTFIDENPKIATISTQLRDLVQELASLKFLTLGQPTPHLFERTQTIIGQLKLIRR